jgi:hypothetical protein
MTKRFLKRADGVSDADLLRAARAMYAALKLCRGNVGGAIEQVIDNALAKVHGES